MKFVVSGLPDQLDLISHDWTVYQLVTVRVELCITTQHRQSIIANTMITN